MEGFAPAAAKFVTNEFFGLLARKGWTVAEVMEYREDMGEAIGDIVELKMRGMISSTQAKEVLEAVWAMPYLGVVDYVMEAGMLGDRKEGELKEVVRGVMEKNGEAVEQARGGKAKAVDFLVGQVMKAMKGKADAVEVRRIVTEM